MEGEIIIVQPNNEAEGLTQPSGLLTRAIKLSNQCGSQKILALMGVSLDFCDPGRCQEGLGVESGVLEWVDVSVCVRDRGHRLLILLPLEAGSCRRTLRRARCETLLLHYGVLRHHQQIDKGASHHFLS